MILPIYIYGMPVLRKVAEDVKADDPEIKQLIDDMYETLDKSGGVGLAGPQVGRQSRVVVIDLNVLAEDYPEYTGYRHAFINAHIVEFGDEKDSSDEGCLSLPGLSEKVVRPTKIRVQYIDEDLNPHDEWVGGYLARVMQHEFDHLEGKLYIDHITPLRKQLIKPKLNRLLRGQVSCNYKCKVARK
ncbi:MAG: peptide deformylase [Prevotellaceae bacterium]|nr:peptide deformylase [Prevotellaceae bacterium]